MCRHVGGWFPFVERRVRLGRGMPRQRPNVWRAKFRTGSGPLLLFPCFMERRTHADQRRSASSQTEGLVCAKSGRTKGSCLRKIARSDLELQDFREGVRKSPPQGAYRIHRIQAFSLSNGNLGKSRRLAARHGYSATRAPRRNPAKSQPRAATAPRRGSGRRRVRPA